LAIFQRIYKGYAGKLTATRYRSLVIFHYSLADVFSSRLFAAFFALCFVHPLVMMITIYMRYNIEVLMELNANLDDLFVIDASFFALWMQLPQFIIASLMIMIVGPALVSPDLRNNAMPLFLSRPVSKASYILGKLLVLLVLGSLITWVPGILLILCQAYLSSDPWLADNLSMPFAAIGSSLLWILALSAMSLAVSAWVKWKVIARLLFFGILFVASALGTAIREIFGGWAGSLISPVDIAEALIKYLYGVVSWGMLPGWGAMTVLLGLTVLFLGLLMRRIRAFEVVA
jgi:ABC-2 type transport system permease protein